MQTKPLITRISDLCIESKYNSDLNLSEDETDKISVFKNKNNNKHLVDSDISIRQYEEKELVNDFIGLNHNVSFSESSSPSISSSGSSSMNSSPSSIKSLDKSNNFNQQTHSEDLISNNVNLLSGCENNFKASHDTSTSMNNKNENNKSIKSDKPSFKFALDDDDLDEDMSDDFSNKTTPEEENNHISSSVEDFNKDKMSSDPISKDCFSEDLEKSDEITNKFEEEKSYNLPTIVNNEYSANENINKSNVISEQNCSVDYLIINDIAVLQETESNLINETYLNKTSPLNVLNNNNNNENRINHDGSINITNSFTKKMEYDENGKPILIVSIELDLLKCCSELLNFEKISKIQKYSIKNDNNEMPFVENTGSKNNSSYSLNNSNSNTNGRCNDIKKLNKLANDYINQDLKRNYSNEQNVLRVKKPKLSDDDLKIVKSEEENRIETKSIIEANILNNAKLKQISASKFSTASGNANPNPTAIVKPLPMTQISLPKANIKQKLGSKFDFLKKYVFFFL
jgi:hypothetical protein